jgi:hypothetical protein
MDYYMPRFFETRSRDLLASELVDKASDGPLHAEFHANYWLVDPPTVVSLANFLA